MLLLAAPGKFVLLDITISMDIYPNPGWEDRDRDAVNSTKYGKTGAHRRENTSTLDCCDILKLRKSAGKPLASVLGGLKCSVYSSTEDQGNEGRWRKRQIRL